MKQFGELKRQEQLALFEAWLDGKEMEFYNPHLNTWFSGDPNWTKGLIYRIKPTQPSIDWDHVHPDYIAIATDEDGTTMLHGHRPDKVHGAWVSGTSTSIRAFASFKEGTCNWQDSLVMRSEK